MGSVRAWPVAHNPSLPAAAVRPGLRHGLAHVVPGPLAVLAAGGATSHPAKCPGPCSQQGRAAVEGVVIGALHALGSCSAGHTARTQAGLGTHVAGGGHTWLSTAKHSPWWNVPCPHKPGLLGTRPPYVHFSRKLAGQRARSHPAQALATYK